MMKTEILHGFHPVVEAVKAKRRIIHELYVIQGRNSPRQKEVLDLAEKGGTPVRRLSPAKMKKMTGVETHQGIAAQTTPYLFADFSNFLELPSPFLLLLDCIVDVHNLGALIRTALCAGVDGVIIPKDRAAPPSPIASKTSAGALEHIRLAQVTNLVKTMQILQKEGVWLCGLDSSGAAPLYKSNLKGSLGLVIGSEEKGIRPLVRKQCDFLVSIPQKGPLDSLNASTAGAVVMYEAFRQRAGENAA